MNFDDLPNFNLEKEIDIIEIDKGFQELREKVEKQQHKIQKEKQYHNIELTKLENIFSNENKNKEKKKSSYKKIYITELEQLEKNDIDAVEKNIEEIRKYLEKNPKPKRKKKVKFFQHKKKKSN